MTARPGVLESVRRVLRLEAETLLAVRDSVGKDYLRAIRMLAACRGKVIVTGMGKSGLIAQKVASTFASTGTPAIYLHPGEAMHGDLGMVEAKDLVLAIGKSGESSELSAILPELRRLGTKILAITSSSNSTLTRFAHLTLRTPVEREACPLNLAPTSSTTAALAVGDALAVALMDLRGFKREHFARLHPGGQLGKRLTLKVDDVMRSGADNPVIALDAAVSRMLVEITRKRAGAVSVVDRRGRLVGLVTDYDIRRAVETGADLFSLSIARIMNARPTTIRSGRMAAEAVEIMASRKNPFNVLPVVDKAGRPVGVVQIHDLRAQGL